MTESSAKAAERTETINIVRTLIDYNKVLKIYETTSQKCLQLHYNANQFDFPKPEELFQFTHHWKSTFWSVEIRSCLSCARKTCTSCTWRCTRTSRRRWTTSWGGELSSTETSEYLDKMKTVFYRQTKTANRLEKWQKTGYNTELRPRTS